MIRRAPLVWMCLLATACESSVDRPASKERPADVPVLASGANGIAGSFCVLFDEGRVACSGALAVPAQDITAMKVLAEVPGLPRVADVAISQLHRQACALDLDGAVWCWGDHRGGALGRGTVDADLAPTSDYGQPARVVGLPPVSALAGATDAFCAIAVDGEVWCWGDNSAGTARPGGEAAAVSTPVVVAGMPRAVRIAATFMQVCAETEAGGVWCWGNLGRRGGVRQPLEIVTGGALEVVPSFQSMVICYTSSDGAPRCTPEPELGARTGDAGTPDDAER
ncbi:MAG: hypothetical protein H6708_17420 [Kofleriaceae bacterium]|nr:hypothetical protein [Myxococcales bacterium]MCB9562187.1 hypothetical protein [Kofleriaceae bacterium]